MRFVTLSYLLLGASIGAHATSLQTVERLYGVTPVQWMQASIQPSPITGGHFEPNGLYVDARGIYSMPP